MSSERAGMLTIIVDEAGDLEEYPDTEGGRTHGLFDKIFRGAPKEIPTEQIQEGIQRTLEQVHTILTDVAGNAVSGWDLESVSVSLAISTGGSVGIVSAGMEAGIEISFVRVK